MEKKMDAEISAEEKELLDESQSMNPVGDDGALKRAQLDSTDEDGELLNDVSAKYDISGQDLDVPGAEDDDANEDIGEEDEENNSYSRADTE